MPPDVQHLLLVLEGPLMAFGREMVDARGPVSDFPAASMLTGLLANALGWRREERERHARLQERLTFAARLDRPGHRMTDFQTAQLGRADRGWTTRGIPEGRDGGAATYNAPHIRPRDYDADKCVAVALRLDPLDEAPGLHDLAAVLDAPARPLFLGRKPCLPTSPLLVGLTAAPDLLVALAAIPQCEDAVRDPLVLLPIRASAERDDAWISDQRNWHTGVHGGVRLVRVRPLSRATGGLAQ